LYTIYVTIYPQEMIKPDFLWKSYRKGWRTFSSHQFS